MDVWVRCVHKPTEILNSLNAKCIYACILTQPYNHQLFLLQRIALNSTFYIYVEYMHACKSVQYTNMHVTSHVNAESINLLRV